MISYHYGTKGSKFTDGRIVRAQVQLRSCESFPCGDSAKDKPMKLPQKSDKTFKITYSYSVVFEVS